jgi:hypothetical protein
MPRFLEAFRNSANVRAACQAAGIERSTPYHHAKTNPKFRAAWDQAREDAIDTLEAVAWKRARESSDYLLWKLLEANRRSFYGARQTVTLEVTDLREKLLAEGEPPEMVDAVIAEIEGRHRQAMKSGGGA